MPEAMELPLVGERTVRPVKKSRPRRRCVIVCVLVLLVGIAAAACWWFLFRPHSDLPALSLGGLGVCYSPEHHSAYFTQTSEIPSVVSADFGQLASSNVKLVRTYFPLYNPGGVPSYPLSDMPASRAAAHGLQLMLGVPWRTPWTDAFVDAAVQQVHGTTSVPYLCVGNEDVTTPTQAGQLLAVIRRLRSLLHKPVAIGTAQRAPDIQRLWADVFQSLSAELDFLGANIYPYPIHPSDIEGNLGSLKQQISTLVSLVGAKKLIVTETGHPSAGTLGATGGYTTAGQAQYRDGVHRLAVDEFPEVKMFLFEAYDEPRKVMGADGTLSTERHYGLWDAEGGLKE